MTFDYKKEYKEFYMPKGTPSIIQMMQMENISSLLDFCMELHLR